MTEAVKNTVLKTEQIMPPVLHGKAKIELFDADSGRKVHEQTDTNIVTNAFQRLLTLPADFMVLDNISDRRCLAALVMPFYKKALSGVLAFSENIAEDEDNVSPTADNLYSQLVGFAGGQYSGTNTMRGTLNSNESGAIDRGYRYVWDFSTDKANGIIKCVCLTPYIVGNLGNLAENYLSGFGFSLMDYYSYNTSNYQQGIIKYQFRIGQDATATGGGLVRTKTGYIMPFYIKRETGRTDIYFLAPYTGDIYVFPVPNSQSLTILDSLGELDLRTKYRVFYENEVQCTHNVEFYNGFIYLWTCNDSSNSVLTKLSVEGEILEQRTVNFDATLLTDAASRVYDAETDMWYGRNSSSMIKVFNGGGETVNSYSVSASYCGSILRVGGRKYIPISVQTYSSSVCAGNYIVLGSDGYPITTVKGSGLPVSTSNSGYAAYTKQVHGFGEEYPYFMQGASSANNYTSSNAFTAYIVLNRALPLLCTINNLSAAITKTTANTMKITYDVTY